MNHLPLICRLEKSSSSGEYGFHLHVEKSGGHFIGKVDVGGIGDRAGLKEGQRIVGVNGFAIRPSNTKKEVVDLMLKFPMGVLILVAAEEVKMDELEMFFRVHYQTFSFEHAQEAFSTKETIPTEPAIRLSPHEKLEMIRDQQRVMSMVESRNYSDLKDSITRLPIRRTPSLPANRSNIGPPVRPSLRCPPPPPQLSPLSGSPSTSSSVIPNLSSSTAVSSAASIDNLDSILGKGCSSEPNVVWREPQTGGPNINNRQSTQFSRAQSMAAEKGIIADVLRMQAHKSALPLVSDNFHQMSLDAPPTLTARNEISKDSGYSSVPGALASKDTAVSPPASAPSDVDVFYSANLTFIRHIEKGGQASVHLASTKFHRKLAVKYFDRNQDKSGEYGRRELVNILRMTAHPNIVHFRGILHDNPESKARNELPLGYLMEYMPDGSLHSGLVPDSPKLFSVVHCQPPAEYSLTDVLDWTRQAASALCYLHSKSILHRDVKPANMLLCNQKKRLKLCDFGLSSGFDVNKTADVGTVLYMAPEVMSSSTSRAVRYDANCDVYSLAISLWEILHRRTPFADEDRSLFALVSDVRGPAALRPEIDDLICASDIKTLIETSWAANPANRTTMDEIHSFVVEKLEKEGFFEDYE